MKPIKPKIKKYPVGDDYIPNHDPNEVEDPSKRPPKKKEPHRPNKRRFPPDPEQPRKPIEEPPTS